MSRHRIDPADETKHILARYSHATLKSVAPGVTPVTYLSLRHMAKSIHKMRRSAAIELDPAVLEEDGQPDRTIVNVHELDATGTRVELLCHVWLDGGDRERLQGALDEAQPQKVAPGVRRVRPRAAA